MTICIYGKNNDIFESNEVSVPATIIDLYNYCGGRISNELFATVINGMVHTTTMEEMVTIFEHFVAGGEPINKIYVGATSFYKAVED